ncbi:flagellar hook-length control protein FliK [[Clostridium] polysaccharolyticum]|uniref:Flagellar hook-length control protein FliK n=1 Tax=[Clostridium] polysaccharolyticum TaxID=29364 RepID=A0A1H9Y1R9_9FIRM|nr:flagellar hook-length control protein FliK [[Clostridium] polysaccharolyticum]SES62752.1 flagellar hook-length control protein FliK [[Clostridium] polysaccharolyticum]
MAQVNKINPVELGSLMASNVNRSVSAKGGFAQVMSSSQGNINHPQKNDIAIQSVHTTKEKLQEGASAAKTLHQADSAEVKDANGMNQVQMTKETEQICSEMAEQVTELKKQISEILGISVDEFEEVMAELGLTVLDLLNPDVLQNILFEVNEITDQTELLTDETLCRQMTDLLDAGQKFEDSVNVEDLAMYAKDLLEKGSMENSLQKPDAESAKANQEEEPAKVLSDVKEEAVSVKEPVITVEKDNMPNSGEDGSRKGKGQEADMQNVQLNQFVQNLSDSIQKTGEVQMENFERLEQMQEIVNQVVERIKVTLSVDATSMEMQLNPENLGKVNFSVVSKNGEMTAAFVVESQVAKEALESQLVVLKENLGEQGIKVEAIEVMVAEQGLSQDQFDNQNGQNFQNRNKQRNAQGKLRGMEDSLEESEEEVKPVLRTGTVDFSA